MSGILFFSCKFRTTVVYGFYLELYYRLSKEFLKFNLDKYNFRSFRSIMFNLLLTYDISGDSTFNTRRSFFFVFRYMKLVSAINCKMRYFQKISFKCWFKSPLVLIRLILLPETICFCFFILTSVPLIVTFYLINVW